MQGRTIPRHRTTMPYYRPAMSQDTQALIQQARDDKELSDVIHGMDVAVHHCRDREFRDDYKIALSRAIGKYGYKAIYEAYR